MTRILAIDLGKFKSTACDYDTASAEHSFTTIWTKPQPPAAAILVRKRWVRSRKVGRSKVGKSKDI